MKTIDRNGSNDIFLSADGQFQMCDGKKCKALILEAAILTLTGELQLDTEQGIPYFSTVFAHSGKIKEWADSVQMRVSEFPWVKNIPSFTYDFNYRTEMLQYSMEVEVDEGVVLIANTVFNTGITIPAGSGGGGDMNEFIDASGNFYLPVIKVGGVQYFRKMTEVVDQYGATVMLSTERYVKDSEGNFVESE